MKEFVLIGVVVLSIIFGYILGRIYPTDGVIRIDHSDPNKDVYRFELKSLDKLHSKNHILLKIDHDAHLSQD